MNRAWSSIGEDCYIRQIKITVGLGRPAFAKNNAIKNLTLMDFNQFSIILLNCYSRDKIDMNDEGKVITKAHMLFVI